MGVWASPLRGPRGARCPRVRTAALILQIGYRHVVDATLQEEACSLASLLVSVTSKGVVTCVRKVGKGSLDPESIFEMLEVRLVLKWALVPGWGRLLPPAPLVTRDILPIFPSSPQFWGLEGSWYKADVAELAEMVLGGGLGPGASDWPIRIPYPLHL